MIINKAYKFELDPNNKAKTLLNKHVGAARFAWNWSLARRILDQGWYTFREQLKYKTYWYGSELIVANRFYPSSKRCSNCGSILKELALSTRSWVCPKCNTKHDRDENASRNLELYPKFLGIKTDKVKMPVEISIEKSKKQELSNFSFTKKCKS